MSRKDAFPLDWSVRRAGALVALCLGFAVLVACSSGTADSPAVTLAPIPASSATGCAREEVLPKITQVKPDEITVGAEVLLIASGGYVKDSCGGYDESARSYPVYLDDEPVGELQCYVNHCEGQFRLPKRADVGRHCLGVQKGTCQMELQVVAG